MPAISTPPIQSGDQYVIRYDAQATATPTDHTFPSVQETVTVFNFGTRNLIALANSTRHLIEPNDSETFKNAQIITLSSSHPAHILQFRMEGRIKTGQTGDGTTDTVARNMAASLDASKADKTTLNLELNYLSNKNAEYIFKQSALVGDGVADDSDKLIQMFEMQKTVGTGSLKMPKGRYLIKKPVYLPMDNFTFDLNGSTIVWNGEDRSLGNGSSRTIGMFNVHGTETGATLQVTAFNLADKSNNSYEAKLTLNDSSSLVKDDYVRLTITTGTYSDTALTPKVDIVARVTRVSGNDVFLAYTNPFRFPQTFTATLKKLNPQRNVEIKNGFIEDIVPIAGALNPNAPYNDREHLVCGLSFQYVVNCRISNINAKGTKFPVVLGRYTSEMKLDSLSLESPGIVGGGEGYLAQINMSTYVDVRNCKSTNARHLVDFTATGFANVTDCHGFAMHGNTFQLHGAYEHDITYKKCTGNWGNGSGTEFGNANMNVSFEEYKGKIQGGGYCENLSFYNSKVLMTRGYTSVVYDNCEVDIYIVNDIEFKKRGEPIPTKLLFKDSKIVFDNSNNNAYIKACDEFVVEGSSKIEFVGNNPDLSVGGKEVFVYDSKYFSIEGAKIDTAKFTMRNSMKLARYKNNECVCRASGFMISNRDMTGIEGEFQIEGNTFDKQAAFAVGAIYAPSTNNVTTSVIHARIAGNRSKGCTMTVRNVGAGKVLLTDTNIQGATITKDTLAVDRDNLVY